MTYFTPGVSTTLAPTAFSSPLAAMQGARYSDVLLAELNQMGRTYTITQVPHWNDAAVGLKRWDSSILGGSMSDKIVREYGTPTPPLVKAVYPNFRDNRSLTVKREDYGITFRATDRATSGGNTAYDVGLTLGMVLELIADLQQMVDQSTQ